ncbi:aldo/keto reductase [Cryptosporangium aurantiacum]|uniref:aldo/keto reductase n=1 Tax=Cryptosporangium aurantiacum TaxID=134849 RepID=UPI000933418E|nr:aldo/keto reductase [Cryptosporangium aurantiacum]
MSRLGLGSWRTFERISRDEGVAVLRAAHEAGLTFLDDARYDDETGGAPIRTGYSEVVFGELFRAAGWPREQAVVANKLWWEFWPEQTPDQELDASLGRMGFDDVDLIYTAPPPDGLDVAEAVERIVALIEAGKARAWGVLNWSAAQVLEAAQIADMRGWPAPAAAQLPYSLVHRDVVEDDHLIRALAAANTGVVASYALVGGVLTGKYDAGADGRHPEALTEPRLAAAVAAGRELAALAAELNTPPAALALAFPLLNPVVASLLTGATRPEQVHANLAALTLVETLDESVAARLRSIGAPSDVETTVTAQ